MSFDTTNVVIYYVYMYVQYVCMYVCMLTYRFSETLRCSPCACLLTWTWTAWSCPLYCSWESEHPIYTYTQVYVFITNTLQLHTYIHQTHV